MNATVTMVDFADIVGEDRTTIRSIIQRQWVPFSLTEASRTEAREYGPREIINWCIFAALRKQGMPVKKAAEVVKDDDPAAVFFDAFDNGKHDILDLHYVFSMRLFLEKKGERSYDQSEFLSSEDVQSKLLGLSRPRQADDLGISSLMIVPITATWVLACNRAKRNGLVLKRDGITRA